MVWFLNIFEREISNSLDNIIWLALVLKDRVAFKSNRWIEQSQINLYQKWNLSKYSNIELPYLFCVFIVHRTSFSVHCIICSVSSKQLINKAPKMFRKCGCVRAQIKTIILFSSTRWLNRNWLNDEMIRQSVRKCLSCRFQDINKIRWSTSQSGNDDDDDTEYTERDEMGDKEWVEVWNEWMNE